MDLAEVIGLDRITTGRPIATGIYSTPTQYALRVANASTDMHDDILQDNQQEPGR
jgi:hypothetical protein